jgi:hypothetical protein
MGFFGGGGSAASNMVGATSSAAGTAGLVPAPAARKERQALLGDATFGFPPLCIPSRLDSSGIYLFPQFIITQGFSGTGGSVFVPNTTYFIPIYLFSGTIDTIFFVSRGNAPTANTSQIHWALYKADGTYLYPKTLIHDAGAMGPFNGLSANTINTVSVNKSVEDGWHYLACSKDASGGGNLNINTFNANPSPVYSNLLGLTTYAGASASPLGALTRASATTSFATDASTYTLAGSVPNNLICAMGVKYT